MGEKRKYIRWTCLIDGIRGVHPGQHATPRYNRQQRDQRAAPYRTEGIQEPLGGERQTVWAPLLHVAGRMSWKPMIQPELCLGSVPKAFHLWKTFLYWDGNFHTTCNGVFSHKRAVHHNGAFLFHLLDTQDSKVIKAQREECVCAIHVLCCMDIVFRACRGCVQ